MASPVTVVIPVHNRERLIERCLKSVTGQQTSFDFEIVVVDDASTDASGTVAKRFGARVLRTDGNRGPGGARNEGLAQVDSEWTAFLDSDDYWAPDHLEILWRHRSGVGLVASTALTKVDEKLRAMGPASPFTVELRRPGAVFSPHNIVATSVVMLRTETALQAGGFSDWRYGEDADLWTRVLQLTPGRVLPQLTAVRFRHPEQIVADPEVDMLAREMYQAFIQRGVLSGRQQRAVRAADMWDRRAALGVGGLLGRADEAAVDPVALAWLLGARFVERHRWRLQPRRAEKLARILADGRDSGRT